MSVADPNAALEGILASLSAKLPGRKFTRSLVDPANLKKQDEAAGVVCIVNEGGGGFANYLGREGDLGELQVALVGFIRVAENTEPAAIEVAELALLHELLDWTNDQGAVRAGDSVLPTDFTQSKQLQHPHGWVLLKLAVRP